MVLERIGCSGTQAIAGKTLIDLSTDIAALTHALAILWITARSEVVPAYQADARKVIGVIDLSGDKEVGKDRYDKNYD